VHKEFIPEVKTVNAEFYKGEMDRLLKRIQRVRPAVSCSRNFFLLHDNASAHKAESVCQFLTQKMLQPFTTPPYSPLLSPPDYFLFPKLKMKLKGLHFAGVAEIPEAVTYELKNVQKEEFSAAFQKPHDHKKALYMPMELILN
jgi:transposase